LFDNFKGDLAHYFSYVGGTRRASHLFYAVLEVSLWAVAIFRFGKAVRRIRFALIRKPLTLIYIFLYKLCEIITGIRISIDSEIAPGLVIHNFGGIIVHGTIGRNCFINQGAQLISRGDGKGRGWPTLGDNVYLGSGAKIVGNVKVGNNVRVGANAVVLDDVPDDCTVMPPESRVKQRRTTRTAAASQGN
jgi:serine O-acetyltransferase